MGQESQRGGCVTPKVDAAALTGILLRSTSCSSYGTVPRIVAEWRMVPNWDAYEVSDDGEVRRVKKSVRGRLTPYLLRPSVGNHGYFQVSLCQDGRLVKVLIHWLVAEAFLGPRSDRHIDHI